MREHGVKVPINLDHSDRAADCLGYIVDMSRRDNTLHAICQFIGENAAELAARNYVSVGIDPSYKDGQDRDYGDAIVHVALTPVPIVPDQSHFALAANIQQAAVLALAATPSPESSTQTPKHVLSASPATLRGLNRLIPGFEQAADGRKIACLCRHLEMIARLDEKYGLAPSRMHLWNFDPDQPRDRKGQWTTGDTAPETTTKEGSGSGATKSAPIARAATEATTQPATTGPTTQSALKDVIDILKGANSKAGQQALIDWLNKHLGSDVWREREDATDMLKGIQPSSDKADLFQHLENALNQNSLTDPEVRTRVQRLVKTYDDHLGERNLAVTGADPTGTTQMNFLQGRDERELQVQVVDSDGTPVRRAGLHVDLDITLPA